MCARFSQVLAVTDLTKLFSVVNTEAKELPAAYNIAPTDLATIIIENDTGEREMQSAKFGLPMNMGGKTFPLVNIQSEKAANRQDFKTRRCIIPVSGFYEWEKINDKDRQPHYFSATSGLLTFAGIWKLEKDVYSFSILTTQANSLLAPIHNRMPVILSHNATGEWLSLKAANDTLTGLMESYPAGLMQSWKVSKTVNNAKNKDAVCINSI